jgi:hypothetical protein
MGNNENGARGWIVGGVGYIPIESRDGLVYAHVDAAHFARLAQFRWRVERGYVIRHEWRDGRGRTVRMHSEVLAPEQGKEIDHIDRNKLDNREDNLRQATRAEQNANRGLFKNNTSGRTGVTWKPTQRRWVAQMKIDGRYVYLGSYLTKEEAIAAREAAERKYPRRYPLTRRTAGDE